MLEEELKQVKIKSRETERNLEELKMKCGIEEGEQTEHDEQVGGIDRDNLKDNYDPIT